MIEIYIEGGLESTTYSISCECYAITYYITHIWRISLDYTKIRRKTSIRYAKENDREKRERRRERERKVEGEI